MSEGTYSRGDDAYLLLAASTVDSRQIIQLPTGEAAVLDSAAGVSSGAYTDELRTRGKFNIEKQTGVVLLAGQEAYWDHSANKATYQRVNDRDFYLGIVVSDASSGSLTATIDLNKRQTYTVDALNRGSLTTIVGTVGYNTMGLFDRCGSKKLILSSTNEAQKVDILSVDGFAVAANAIVEAVFRPISVGSGTAPDFNIGLASGTHATDFESVAEFVTVHLNGNASDLFAESDDGTTDVAETDTTINITVGSAVANRVHVLFDTRNPSDVQIYVNGALVLDGTTFTLAAATGPLYLIAHLEKTAAADTFEVDIDTLRAWTSEQ